MSSQFVFNEAYYLSQYADVRAAVAAGLITAQAHWEQFGWREERNPNAQFNTAYYATNNTDVVAAQVNYLDHFLANGASEGRLPNSSWAGTDLTKFDSEAYYAANPDVKTTGMDALTHYMLHGQFEARTGAQLTDGTVITAPTADANAGQTFTLTTGVDNITGTSGDDKSYAIDSATLQSWDILDGGAGTDTLNISAGAFASSVAPVISNVEIINNANLAGAYTADFVLNLGAVTGVQQLNTDFSGAEGYQSIVYNNASSATTFGLSGLAAEGKNQGTVGINLAGSLAGDQTVNLSLSGNATDSFMEVNIQDGVENVAIDLAEGNSGGLLLNAHGAETITVTGAGDVTFFNLPDGLEIFNAGAATGDIEVGPLPDGMTKYIPALTEDASITTGSGNDELNFSRSKGDLTIDAGAGNDIIKGGAGNDTIIAGAGKNDLTGGDGEDTFVLDIKGTLLSNLDVINDFNVGNVQDTLVFGETELTNDNFGSVSRAATYSGLRDLAQDEFSDDVSFVAGVFDGDTYVFHDADGDGVADAAVKLIGTDNLLDADAFAVV